MKKTTILILLVAGLAMTAGCEEDDERLAEMARDATRRQAEQNQEMVRLNREVSIAHQRVIEADLGSRVAENLTPEFYQQHATKQQAEQRH